MPGDGSFHGLGEVAGQVPPAGDLDGQRRADSDAL
jgi:hypothetical protein